MTYREVLSRYAVAISASDSPDMAILGLNDDHLKDATAEIARHLLALGARLVYGGDLRAQGFSELLFELVARHTRDADLEDGRIGVVDYLAWPVHITKSRQQLEVAAADLVGSADLVYLDLNGMPLDFQTRLHSPAQLPSEAQWSDGLTAMRRTMLAATQARIVLGGRVEGYRGVMPGTAEEALLSLEAGQPLFLLGGFGGCARDIAEQLKLVPQSATSGRTWSGIDRFSGYVGSKLGNGLTLEENAALASTPHVDQAIILVLRGLTRVGGAGQRS